MICTKSPDGPFLALADFAVDARQSYMGRRLSLATLIANYFGVSSACVRKWRSEGARLDDGEALVTFLLGRGNWGHSVLDDYPIHSPRFLDQMVSDIDHLAELSQPEIAKGTHRKASGDTSTPTRDWG